MALPIFSDLVTYVNKAITGNDWNTNWQKVINWLTGGNTDIKIKSLEISSTGGINNKGTLTQSGNVDITGDINSTGTITANDFVGDGSKLTGIVSSSTISYTPFTVNSAYIDITPASATFGQEQVMYKESGYNNLIKFNVAQDKPLTATTSDGQTFTLELLEDFDVSNTGNGKYIVCVKKGQQRAELKEGANGVYRQRTAPTDVAIPNNSLWLNTSTENIQCYERLENNWNTKYDGVPLGEVTVSSGEITDILVYHYNWNGYDINTQEEINIYERPAVIIKTWRANNINYGTEQSQCDWCVEYSNGYVEQGGRIFSYRPEASTTAAVTFHTSISKLCALNTTGMYNFGDSYTPVAAYFYSFSGGTLSLRFGSHNQKTTATMWHVTGYK